MKRYRALLAACILSFPAAPAAASGVKVVPYYSFRFVDGAAVPSKGEAMFSTALSGDLGLIVQPDERNRFVGFYELKYNGPGLRRVEGEKFTDRLIDHVATLRHHYSLSGLYTLKSQLDYMKEYKRSGTNEVWGAGLYDFSRFGGGVTLERSFARDRSASLGLFYHAVDFPNYTDLLTEHQLSRGSEEIAGGKQNHVLWRTALSGRYGRLRASLDYTVLSYTKQRVVSSSVQADGTYYSGTRQRDTLVELRLGGTQRLRDSLVLDPSVVLRLKDSNQNFQYFRQDDAVPVEYYGDYYDYTQITLSVPATVLLGGTWEYFLNPEFERREYSSRPPRDAGGDYRTGTQANELLVLGTGFTCKPNPVTRTTFFYTWQQHRSNTRYEVYLPYNYTGHFFGVAFDYTY